MDRIDTNGIDTKALALPPHPTAGRPADLTGRVAALEAEVAELRRLLTVLTEVERYRDVALRRHATLPWTPPTRLRLEARDFQDCAEGIHFLEYAEFRHRLSLDRPHASVALPL